MHAYAYANANAMQLRTKHLKCYTRHREHLHRARGIPLALPVLSYSRLVHRITVLASSTSRGHGATTEAVTLTHSSPSLCTSLSLWCSARHSHAFGFRRGGRKCCTGVRHGAWLATSHGRLVGITVQWWGTFPFVLHHLIYVERSILERSPSGLKSIHHGPVDTANRAHASAPTVGRVNRTNQRAPHGRLVSWKSGQPWPAAWLLLLAPVFCRNQATVHLRSKWFLFCPVFIYFSPWVSCK
jgi:hypothetical protein